MWASLPQALTGFKNKAMVGAVKVGILFNTRHEKAARIHKPANHAPTRRISGSCQTTQKTQSSVARTKCCELV
jgi:hypothetical protein